jgi:hypothetical protein
MLHRICRYLLLVPLFSLPGLTTLATANTIGWHPSSPLYLGATFDPDDPTDTKVPCLKDLTAVPVDTGAPTTEFRSSLISERRELYQLFSVSASLSASFGMSSGGGSVSALSEVTFDSETIVWALSARSNYGRTALSKVDLKDEFKNLSSAVLKATCGTHVIVMDRREAVVSAIFSFHSSSRKTRDEIRGALSASWTGGSFSTNLSNDLKQALTRTEVTFVFIAKGGDGLTATSGFVSAFDKLDEIRKQVALYILGMDRTKAPAAEYFPARLPPFSDVQIMLGTRERTLSALWYDYLRYDEVLAEAKRKLAHLDEYWYLEPNTLRAYLVSTAQDASSKLDAISKIAEECTADKNKCMYQVAGIYSTPVDWPSINPVYRGGGFACQNNKCTGSAIFLLRIGGPGRTTSIRKDRIGLSFPGGKWGYNCRYEPPVLSVEGLEMRCTMSYDKTAFDKEKADLLISDLASGSEALRMRFVEAAPDANWP